MSGAKIFLVDIDGTICDDIPNEQSELFSTAQPYVGAKEILNGYIDEGHEVHYFTARREQHRKVTEEWLENNGFRYSSLVMNKPRIKDGQEYVWIDNKKIRGITFKGKWSKLVEKVKKILVFDDSQP